MAHRTLNVAVKQGLNVDKAKKNKENIGGGYQCQSLM